MRYCERGGNLCAALSSLKRDKKTVPEKTRAQLHYGKCV